MVTLQGWRAGSHWRLAGAGGGNATRVAGWLTLEAEAGHTGVSDVRAPTGSAKPAPREQGQPIVQEVIAGRNAKTPPPPPTSLKQCRGSPIPVKRVQISA